MSQRLLAGLLGLSLLLVLSPSAQARKGRAQSGAGAPSWLRAAAEIDVGGNLAGAGTVLLHDELRVEPLAAGGVRMTRRQAWRVLKPEGLAQVGALSFTYSEGDLVERGTVWNLLPDGSVRRPKPKDDVIDMAWTQDGNLIDDTRFRRIEVPGCRVGSVIGSEWSVVHEFDLGAVIETFGSTTRPVGRCLIELRLPAGWSWDDLGERTEAFTRSETPRGVLWEAGGLRPPPREELPPPAEELLPRIAVRWFSPDGSRGFRDWDAVGDWYRALSEGTLGQPGESVQLAERFKPAGPAELEEALRAAFLFSSRDVRYVSVQLGIGGFRPATPERTCSVRHGDCKAKSFLMRSIVERWGLESYPVLVRTSTIGELLEAVPTPGQFNHCVVAVKLPEGMAEEAWNVIELDGIGRLAVMDATTTVLGPWQLREDDQDTLGLLVTPEGGRLIELPVQPPEAASTHWSLELRVDPSGSLVSGTVSWTSEGTEGGDARRGLASQSEDALRRIAESFAQAFVPGSSLDEHEVLGLDSTDGSVEVRMTLSGGRVGQPAGELLIIESPVSPSPIPVGSLGPGKRSEALSLGLPRERRVDVAVHAPEGWVPEGLPDAFAAENGWMRMEGSWDATETGYRFSGLGQTRRTRVAAEDYAAFRSELRAVAAKAAEGVVLVPASR